MLAALMLLIYQACGYVCVTRALPGEKFIFRALLGSVLGNLLLMWLPVLFAFAFGFTRLTHWMALGVALAAAILLSFRNIQLLKPKPIQDTKHLLACVVPMTLLACYLIWNNTLRPSDGALNTGQSGFGDMSMHLGFITSLAKQGTFPPEYSISPGVKLGYPFLCDSISASLYLFGMPLRLSYALPMMLAMAQVFLGYYLLMIKWLSRPGRAALAFWLFFLGGGFGFAYFMDGLRDNPENFIRIFTAFYQTPTNLITENIRWVNPLVDMMLPQRATLFGWAALLPCLCLAHDMAFKGGEAAWQTGVLAGLMPMVHTHSYLALAIFSLGLAIYSLREPMNRRALLRALKLWGIYAGVAAALSLPQLLYWTLGQSSAGGFIRLSLNWGNINDNILWFYVKNMGIVFLSLVPAALSGKGRRRFWLCSLPVWIVAELVVFQPNEYDNNKLLFVVHMLSCGLVAAFFADIYARLRGLGGRRLLAATTIFFATFSGVLTIAREAVSDLELFSADHVRAAKFVEENLPSDAVILTNDRHNNSLAALAGRSIVQGSPSYLYFHGVYSPQVRDDVAKMLTDPDGLRLLGEKYNVSYVCLSEYERDMGSGEHVFEGLPLIYQHGNVSIYRIPTEY